MSTIYNIMVIFRSGFAHTKREADAFLISKEAFKNYLELPDVLTPFGYCFIAGQKKNLDKDELRWCIQEQPWLRPETLQIFIKSEHDDKFIELDFEEPQGYINPGCAAWQLPTKEMLNSYREKINRELK